MRAYHALATLILGIGFGIVWLRVFARDPRSAPAVVVGAPIAVAIMGLGHWVAYDFSLMHWAGDFSLFQALFNIFVAAVLLARRAERAVEPPTVSRT